MRVLICIPTYNERDNVEALARDIFAATQRSEVPLSLELLFIDDGSPDGTGALLDQLAAQNPRLHVLHRAGKLGLATAYLAGFAWGLEQGFDWILEMDADFSHDPAHLNAFVAAMASGHADVVCGSRYIAGGGVSDWSWGRVMLSRMGSVYSSFWLDYPVADWTGGFNAWSRTALERLHLESIRTKGYAFQIELKYRALLLGLRLMELPIVFRERRAGQSKMSGSIVKEALWAVAQLRWRHQQARLFF